MSRLESEKRKQNEKHNNQPGASSLFVNETSQYDRQDIDRERQMMYDSIRSLSSVLDSSGEYRIMSFISTSRVLQSSRWKYSVLSKVETLDGFTASNNLYRRNDVALVTHTTPSQLHYLDLLSHRWQGLMSVSVFATSIEQLPITVEIILLLRYCLPSIRNKVSFHLVYPLSLSAKFSQRQAPTILDYLRWSQLNDSLPSLQNFTTDETCHNLPSSIEAIVTGHQQNYGHGVAYPNNLLRNIGRRYALTEYTFVIDIDLVPSAGLYEHFLEFGRRTRLFKDADNFIDHISVHDEDRIVFVVPAFEMDRANRTEQELINVFPSDKITLAQLIQAKRIRPFYIELCWKCQRHTDYEAWLHSSLFANSSQDDNVDILFEVLWKDPWEPFYISRNTAPFYDERFQQYGFNRISQVSEKTLRTLQLNSSLVYSSPGQVCELNMARYRFAVLNNAFLVHDGFKQTNTFHATKDAELEHNRMLFRQFKLQLKERYPKSNRRC